MDAQRTCLQLHPAIAIQRLAIGNERAPLLVIDNVVADAETLVDAAISQQFTASTRHYPGIRAQAPLAYQQLLAERLGGLLSAYFRIEAKSVRFSMCHFSLVTTPAADLAAIQRIPHVDSLGGDGLASIHYLFHDDLGGTAFYRHRSTGFEVVDQDRAPTYFAALERETANPDEVAAGYINGDTDLFEQVSQQHSLFNRMLVYRRNSLHSGSIAPDFLPDPYPRTGRLSINSFIDFGR